MTNAPVIAFKYSSKFRSLGLFMLITGIILMLLLLMAPPNASATSAPMILIIFGILNMTMYGGDCLKIYSNFLELKPAPLAGLKIVKFDDIKGFNVDGKVMLLHTASNNKPIKLHARLFNKADIPQIHDTLKKVSKQAA